MRNKKKKSQKEKEKSDFQAPQLLSAGLSLWPEEIGGLEDWVLALTGCSWRLVCGLLEAGQQLRRSTVASSLSGIVWTNVKGHRQLGRITLPLQGSRRHSICRCIRPVRADAANERLEVFAVETREVPVQPGAPSVSGLSLNAS